MRENRPYGSEGGEQRYCSPTPIGLRAHGAPLLLDPGLRRDDDVVESRQIQSARLFRGDVLPTFVAPAPGRSPGLRAHGAPLLLDPGLRRDDDVVESRPDSK